MLEDDGVLSDEQRDRTTEPQYPSYFRDYYPIDKTLANLTENDLELSLIPIDGDIEVNTLCYLVFEKTPTLSQTHELTVRIQLSDGRVFSPTITKTWEEESE
jgi:hypothetical protein